MEIVVMRPDSTTSAIEVNTMPDFAGTKFSLSAPRCLVHQKDLGSDRALRLTSHSFGPYSNARFVDFQKSNEAAPPRPATKQ